MGKNKKPRSAFDLGDTRSKRLKAITLSDVPMRFAAEEFPAIPGADHAFVMRMVNNTPAPGDLEIIRNNRLDRDIAEVVLDYVDVAEGRRLAARHRGEYPLGFYFGAGYTFTGWEGNPLLDVGLNRRNEAKWFRLTLAEFSLPMKALDDEVERPRAFAFVRRHEDLLRWGPGVPRETAERYRNAAYYEKHVLGQYSAETVKDMVTNMARVSLNSSYVTDVMDLLAMNEVNGDIVRAMEVIYDLNAHGLPETIPDLLEKCTNSEEVLAVYGTCATRVQSWTQSVLPLVLYAAGGFHHFRLEDASYNSLIEACNQITASGGLEGYDLRFIPNGRLVPKKVLNDGRSITTFGVSFPPGSSIRDAVIRFTEVGSGLDGKLELHVLSAGRWTSIVWMVGGQGIVGGCVVALNEPTAFLLLALASAILTADSRIVAISGGGAEERTASSGRKVTVPHERVAYFNVTGTVRAWSERRVQEKPAEAAEHEKRKVAPHTVGKHLVEPHQRKLEMDRARAERRGLKPLSELDDGRVVVAIPVRAHTRGTGPLKSRSTVLKGVDFGDVLKGVQK